MKKKLSVSIFLAVVFLLAQFLTLRDYGTSWDETLHFSRGHVYLNYFLTGTKEYDSTNPRKSFYQLDYQAGDFFFKDKPGHPPVSGILASTANYILYQKLGWLGDIHSYHVFNIAVSSLIVFVTVFFAAEILGVFGALVSFLALVTYPIFFAESHFNVKDPAETAFFATTIWTFYKFLNKGSWKWLFSSIVFFSLGLGTKFNILFLPFIILPFLGLRFKKYFVKFPKISTPTGALIVLLLSPLIVAAIFIGIWPYLWTNWPNNLLEVAKYYQRIGIGTQYQPEYFYIAGFNTFALQWIIFTTPPFVLFLFSVGLISAWFNRRLKHGVTLLWVLWFAVPVLRVSVPGSSIYGGVRQIMEFLPAMALICGLGAWQIISWVKSARDKFYGQDTRIILMIKILIITSFLWPAYILVKLHPNQNVYFNSLIGRLKGAKAQNFPSWGNSYGNAYLQGIGWLNQNAEPGSRVALIQGTETNAPVILFRKDIKFRNANWSGLDREGEYLMDLIFNDTGRAFGYTWEYTDKFLEPVYEVKVDNVAILKIWKNDLTHTREDYRISDERYGGEYSQDIQKNIFYIVYPKEFNLSKIVISFNGNNCVPIKDSIVETVDANGNVLRETDAIPFYQLRNSINLEENRLTLYFAAKKALTVKLTLNNDNSCLFKGTDIKTYIFKGLP